MKILLEIIDANFRPRILKITKKKDYENKL